MNTYNNKYDILASNIAPNPVTVKYWADLASNPNGGDLKFYNGTKWALVNEQDNSDNPEIEDIKQEVAALESTVSSLSTTVGNKVDKVAGKDLSTNDYSNEEKGKVASAGNGVSALTGQFLSMDLKVKDLEARIAALENPTA